MRSAIRKHIKDFAALIGLAIVAFAVAGYTLAHQRLRFPIIQSAPYKLKAEFSTAQAVTPGQGQTVRVSGVRIGDISKVDLSEGRAIVTMDVDPQYKDLVHTDASALLRPKTGLKDMFIELNPGSKSAPVAKQGWTIPVKNTLPDVNPDEVYALLDADTRDYLRLLISGAGQGLHNRGGDLQEVFRRFEPTHKDLALVNKYVALRHRNLRRLIHQLNVFNGALAQRGDDLAELVGTSSTVFRALASEDTNITRAVGDLPGTLRQTTQTFGKVKTLADVLGPAVTKLRPTVKALDSANKQVTPFAKEAAPILRTAIRPFIRDARPVVRNLKPASKNLASATPDLTRSFTVLNHLFNMLGFNPNGREGPEVAKRDEGFLFWIAWLDHDGAALFSGSDANGPFRPVTLGAPCSTLKQTGDANEPLGMMLAPALADPHVCGS
jgi:phospholipid/cholesterol/gamma-HCH transport system substrate-binding protein